MNKRFLFTLLIITGLLAGYYEFQLPNLTDPDKISDRPPSLKFYASDITSLSFDKKGQLNTQLNSPYTSHQEGSEFVNFEQPILTTFNPAPEWLANAEYGEVNRKNKIITLKKSVVLSKIDTKKKASTDKLFIDTKKKIAYSSSKVKILSKSSIITAKGMHIDFNNETFHLQSNVNAHYVPTINRPTDT